MAAEKILAVVAAKDRIIEQQSLVMNLARQVISNKDIEGAVQMLIDATYKVVPCDGVFLFLKEGDELVCHVCPAGGKLHWRLPLGEGIAGHVGKSGKILNIGEAAIGPHLCDPALARLPGGTPASVLCLALRDCDDEVIGVLQAVNKHGAASERVAFDAADERLLELLLALTAQQLRFCELVMAREKATARAESMLELVEAMSAEREISTTVAVLARATVGLLNCQLALVFLKDHGSSSLICHAAEPCAFGRSAYQDLRVPAVSEIFGEVLSTGKPQLLENGTGRRQLAALERMLSSTDTPPEQPLRSATPNTRLTLNTNDIMALPKQLLVVQSALVAPLPDRGTGEVLGVVIAVNRVLAFGDAEAEEQAGFSETEDRRRFSSVNALSSLLCSNAQHSKVVPFSQVDLTTLSVLSNSAANIVKNADLYDRERSFHCRLSALLALLADARAALQAKNARMLMRKVSSRSKQMFECDRCTFWTLDNFSNQLVGHFVTDDDNKEGDATPANGEAADLRELRVPLQGIVGCVVKSGQPLNITDARNDPRFASDTDRKTGYCTRTILCAPLVASNGRLIGVLQCINKRRGKMFGKDDEDMLNTVSFTLSDLIQRTLLEHSYDSFIDSNDGIIDEVKNMYRFFDSGGSSKREQSEALSLKSPKVRPQENTELMNKLRSWDWDHFPLHDDVQKFAPVISMAFGKLGLQERFEMGTASFEGLLRSLKASYKPHTPYHSWSHAFCTWHSSFLLLDGPAIAGLVPQEDMLAVLIAALGHDADHPGTANSFQVASQSLLALRYNDVSVLENHHASLTCSVVQNGAPSVLDYMPLATKQRIRQVIVHSILHTDMQKHKDGVNWLESNNLDLPGQRKAGKTLNYEDSLHLCGVVLHSGDLGHPAMPWKKHKQLSVLIAKEFYAQYQEEQRLGLPSLPFMGKDPSQIQDLAPIQVGFIQFVATPLWAALSFHTGDTLGEVLENINANKSRWERLGKGEEVAEEQPFCPPKMP